MVAVEVHVASRRARAFSVDVEESNDGGAGAARRGHVGRQWRAFGSRRYLRWRPDGRTDGQNGRFTLSHGELSYELVITQAGRLRQSSAVPWWVSP